MGDITWPIIATFILAFVTFIMACGTLLMAIETRKHRKLYEEYINRTILHLDIPMARVKRSWRQRILHRSRA